MTRCVMAAMALLLAATPVSAQEEPGSEPKEEEAEVEPDEARPQSGGKSTKGDGEGTEEEPPRYRNPRGSVVLQGGLGIAIGSDRTVVQVGVGVGYAVLTGVVPGVRLVVISDDGVAAELAGTLTLTPPLSTYFVPFLVGEAGRRFDSLGAWLYGGGGGLYLGEPEARFGLQLGWMFRRLVYEDRSFDASGPIIALSFSF